MYRDAIATALSNNDPATITLIESLMRDEHGTLDGLSKPAFTRAARGAMAMALELAFAKLLPEYCEPLGIDVPTLRV